MQTSSIGTVPRSAMVSMEDFEGGRGLPCPIQPDEQYYCSLWEGFPKVVVDDLPGSGGSFSGQLIRESTPFAADGLQLPEFVAKQLWDVPPEAFGDGAAPEEHRHGHDKIASCSCCREVLHHDYLCSSRDNYYRKPDAGEQIAGGDHESQLQEEERRMMRLLAVLIECAVAISVDDLQEAHRMLLELTHVASPYSPSSAERLVAYFAQAMAGRVMSSYLQDICCAGPRALVDQYYRSDVDLFGECRLFGDIAPFVKFAYFSANQAIMEALHGRDPVHIIDLDAMQGLLQYWPALLHALAARDGGPPRVRMTALGVSPDATAAETGRRLCELARRLGVSFEFRAVAERAGEVDPAVVRTRSGETAAVHWLRRHSSLYNNDATGPDAGTMRLLEVAAPRVIALVEQEVAAQAGSTFLDRFAGSLHHYAAVFDALGESLSREDPGRQRVESRLLAREVSRVLAVDEAPTRINGEERIACWRGELARRGRFAQVPISFGAVAQAQAVLAMFQPGYTLHYHGDGTLGLGWKGTRLYTASAWTSLVSLQ